jgi:hypothetical protein
MIPARVQLLGPVRAFERDLTAGPSRQQAVFAVLATKAGEVVSTDELIGAVWQGPPAATAAERISVCAECCGKPVCRHGKRSHQWPKGTSYDSIRS